MRGSGASGSTQADLDLGIRGGNDEARGVFRRVIFVGGLVLHFDPTRIGAEFFPITQMRGEIGTAGDVAQVG